jgi:hypothetical protein
LSVRRIRAPERGPQRMERENHGEARSREHRADLVVTMAAAMTSLLHHLQNGNAAGPPARGVDLRGRVRASTWFAFASWPRRSFRSVAALWRAKSLRSSRQPAPGWTGSRSRCSLLGSCGGLPFPSGRCRAGNVCCPPWPHSWLSTVGSRPLASRYAGAFFPLRFLPSQRHRHRSAKGVRRRSSRQPWLADLQILSVCSTAAVTVWTPLKGWKIHIRPISAGMQTRQ